METSRTRGDRSAVRKIEGRSPLVTPPGTPPTVAGTAAGAATGTWPPPTPGGGVATDATSPAPGSGDASPMSNGGSVAPPGVATIETDVSARAWVSRLV